MKKVLIVDNSSFMRKFVKKIIEKDGLYTAVEAVDKVTAMEMFNSEKPDIVLLDLNMTESTMDGLEVLTDILKIAPAAVVFIMSAVGHQKVKDQCIELGAKGYISKPIDSGVLLKELGEY
ncbi:response regulator [Clostridium oryzae]|uniref:Stage 0 sporulation protein A homolog n=1 Tax=Clostridium oryzae TaxID=1450648 RepID=A0A1V4ID62_9CLOT|nr:response regulator [Clostridium oryzae]OPJ57948.1 chemotaxis protein CheY [Clostridium oryzae]